RNTCLLKLSRIVDQLAELRGHFEMARCTEKCYLAEMLHGMYEYQTDLGNLLFLRPILRGYPEAWLKKCNFPTKRRGSPEDITFIGSKHFVRSEGASDSSAGSNGSSP
ncbi:uncharacterized protein LOC121837690, partial [Ixodes scapularis]|uniref:uncharacterized protein LOC121837690 n=1 Tax=Ixodes scapularis TaxID=6945 RepID=UPI001C392316